MGEEVAKFDCIVIGSGMGGMSVAATLAKNGKKILLLEQHFVFGGYTHTFKRGKYEWDVGLHYIGQVHKEGSFIRKAFDYLSNNQLKWIALDDTYDKAVFGNETFNFVSGAKAQKSNLKIYFPDQKDHIAIDKYFELLDEVGELGNAYYIEKIFPPLLSTIFGPILQKKLLHFSDSTTLDILQKITDNEKLIAVLTAQYGDYGLPPSKSSFYMHAMVANHYMDGAGYPIGGAASLANNIIPVIKDHGGIVKNRAKVTEIIVEQNKAIGVILDNGEKHFADYIISDTGVYNTFLNLLPAEVSKEHQLTEKIKALKPSIAHISLSIGCKGSSKDLQLPKCNYWIFPENYNHDKNQLAYDNLDAPLPVIFASSPSAKNPEWDKKHPNTSTLEVIGLVPYEWFSKWEGTSIGKRGADYEALKEKLAQQMLKMLLGVLPQLENQIEFYEVSTPLSTKKFTNHFKGEIYGLDHSPSRFREKLLRPSTPIKNLYLTGQDVFMGSVSGAMMGGILTASMILKKNLFSKIENKPS